MRQLTPFVNAQIDPRRFEEIRPDGTTYNPAYHNARAFIEAWKKDYPEEYDEKKEAWRKYLKALDEISATKDQRRRAEPKRSRQRPHLTRIEDAVHFQGPENVATELRDGSSKSNSTP